MRIVKDKIADYIDPPRVYPLVGPAQLHHAHYKCTIYFTEVTRVGWPLPYTTSADDAQEVVYIDHDHLHMVGNVNTGASANLLSRSRPRHPHRQSSKPKEPRVPWAFFVCAARTARHWPQASFRRRLAAGSLAASPSPRRDSRESRLAAWPLRRYHTAPNSRQFRLPGPNHASPGCYPAHCSVGFVPARRLTS